MADPARLYRLLLKLYPARFREEYGGPLKLQFLDDYRDAGGAWARAILWARTIFDLAVSIPQQLAVEIGQDVRYSLRMHSQRPLMTILIIAALALGIGAATGVFSVVNALLIRSLPFRAPERLVQLWMFAAPRETPAAFHEWRRQSNYLEDAALYEAGLSYEMNLDTSSRAARVRVAETSWNFFAMLGSDPILGRSFLPGEDVPGRDSVAVLGYGLWQEAFGGDPRIIGSTIHLNGEPTTVVGIARPAFDYPYKASVWTPTAFDIKRLPKNGPIFWETIGRLKPGLREQQVVDMFLAEVAHRRQSENRASVKPLRDLLAGGMREASLVLLGAVVFVLLIACANVANLLLTRFNGRRTELALRTALGASRARLLQQLVVESVLLTSVAAAAGIAVANWAARLTSSAQPGRLDLEGYSLVDWRVLGFAAGVAVLTGIVFGVVPASLAGRLEIWGVGSSGRTWRAGSGRFQRGLVFLQVFLAIVLVSGSMVMGRGFLKLLHTDLGFRTANVVTMSVSLLGTHYESGIQRRQYYDHVLERLRAVPGVEAAGAVDYLPLDAKAFAMGSFVLDSGAPGPRGTRIVTASSGYFRAMGSDISYGRDFSSNAAPAELEAIVNEDFARQEGGVHLVGRHMKCPWIKEPILVVGIARTFRYAGPSHEGGPQVYLSEQQAPPVFATFTARVNGNPRAYLAICRDRIQALDRSVPVFNVKTLDDRLSENLAAPRLYTTAGMFFGGFALLLAIIGTYGVASQWVTQRTHEIGVRIAVGGSPRAVRAMLLGQSIWPVLSGIAAGLWGAMALGSVLQVLVEAAEPVSWSTCEAAAALLALFAVGAIWSASRRVTVLNAVEILRAE